MYKNLRTALMNEEEKRDHLSDKTLEVYEIILEKWPTNPSEIASEREEVNKENRKGMSSKYLYHVRKLEDADLVHTKKLGNTYVVWPKEIERLRLLNELFGE